MSETMSARGFARTEAVYRRDAMRDELQACEMVNGAALIFAEAILKARDLTTSRVDELNELLDALNEYVPDAARWREDVTEEYQRGE
jgi:hypothetical protein